MSDRPLGERDALLAEQVLTDEARHVLAEADARRVECRELRAA